MCYGSALRKNGESKFLRLTQLKILCAYQLLSPIFISLLKIELSGILSWPSPSSAQAFSVPSSGQGNDSAPRRDLMILDNACGASALVTNQLINILPIELMEEAQLVATDVSAGVIAEATRRIAETDWADHIFTYKMAQEVSR